MDSKPVFKRILKRGAIGDDVRLAQERLNSAGYGILAADGIYGPRTEDSVCRFQMDRRGPNGDRLAVDGIVGPLTWWALFNGIDSQEPETPIVKINNKSGVLMRASLDTAVRELRRKVREIPPGSNRGPEVEDYLKCVGCRPGDAWCAAFVCWCVERASNALGLENPLKRTGKVSLLWQWALENGNSISIEDVRGGKIEIPVGAIFCAVYSTGRGHTGFVERREGDTLHTVEGNTVSSGSSDGEGVYAKRRSLSRYKGIQGFIAY